MDITPMREIKNITITPEILKLIADIDEFKGRWKVIESLAPEKLTSLRRHDRERRVLHSHRGIQTQRCGGREAALRATARDLCQPR
jgi:hypothetical protein